jgi:hypothetical protein
MKHIFEELSIDKLFLPEWVITIAITGLSML